MRASKRIARLAENPNLLGMMTGKDADIFAGDLRALLSANEALARENERLREALIHAIEVAEEAFNEWDAAPDGMRAGKILKALSGSAPRYRADIDAIHDALIPPENRQTLEPSHDQ